MTLVMSVTVAPLLLSFGRTDVAFAYVAAAIPFGLQLAALRFRAATRIALGMMLAAIGLLAVAAISFDSAFLFLARTALALAVVGSLGLAVGGIALFPPQGLRMPWLTASLAVAFIVPLTYAGAVTQSLRERGEALATQSRLQEAADVVATQVALDPQSEFLDQPVSKASAELVARVESLRQRRSAPVASNASTEERLSAARDWAMLNEAEQAIETLEPLILTDSPDPRACQLLATIAQSREEWEQSLFWFQTSEQRWRAEPSDGALRGQVESLLGIGFANRKLGRLREAEAAYKEALEVSPTPDVHFLLAQFYGDAQRATEAVHHANQAAFRDRRYRLPAEKLTDRLMTHDFGCLPVFLNRRDDQGAASLSR